MGGDVSLPHPLTLPLPGLNQLNLPGLNQLNPIEADLSRILDIWTVSLRTRRRPLFFRPH
jgi:hypothetical protein